MSVLQCCAVIAAAVLTCRRSLTSQPIARMITSLQGQGAATSLWVTLLLLVTSNLVIMSLRGSASQGASAAEQMEDGDSQEQIAHNIGCCIPSRTSRMSRVTLFLGPSTLGARLLSVWGSGGGVTSACKLHTCEA
jgi:hypothetical protein